MNTKTITAILSGLLMLSAVSCRNGGKESAAMAEESVTGILSADIVGAWDMIESLEQTADGWKDEELPDDYRYIMNYRTDGIIEGTLTENGHTGTGECPYLVDDSLRTIKQMWRVYNVERLTRDTLVVVFQYSPGPEATDSIIAKCTYLRLKNDDYPRK